MNIEIIIMLSVVTAMICGAMAWMAFGAVAGLLLFAISLPLSYLLYAVAAVGGSDYNTTDKNDE